MKVRTHDWLMLAALLLWPGLAEGQGAVSPPRVSIGAGGGVAFPFHGDFDFTPWAWEAGLRVLMSRHTLFEAAVGEWRHSETRVLQSIAAAGGLIGRLDQTTSRTQRTVQANVLVTTAPGRVRVIAGGGVGLLQHHRRTRQVLTDCPPTVRCGSPESTFSNVSGAAQGVGGVEVGLSGGPASTGRGGLSCR